MEAKTMYHAVRRASVRVYANINVGGKPSVFRERQKGAIARAFSAPRGFAKTRDMMAAAVASSRSDLSRGTLSERLAVFVAEKYSVVVVDRGGETTIEEKDRTISLRTLDRRDGLTLLGADGWRHYSNRFGARRASLRYLCGRDDNGEFAVRLPGTVDTVAQAIDALEPAEVRVARAEGRSVLRQGDVYVISLMAGARDNFRALPDSHTWDAGTRTVRHTGENPHQALHVPFSPAKAVPQTALRMGRISGARTGRGD